MDKKGNEIKFIKNRSNGVNEVVENFKKSNYYDAFYLYNKLDKEDRLALIPLVVDTYSKLKKGDYEAKALFEMLVQSDEIKNVSAIDKKVVTMRLSEYYNSNGEKLGKVRVVQERQDQDFESEKRNIIKFEKSQNAIAEVGENSCKIYSKNNLSVDKADYLCDRATSLAMVKRYREALEVLDKVGKRSARYFDAQKLRVAILIDCGRFDEVVDIAIEILKHNPNEFICLFALNICISMDNGKDKIFDFLRGLNGAQGLQINILRARAFAEIDKLKKGVEILNSLESPDRFAHEALTLKAILYDGLDDKKMEEQTLREIITIYPNEVEARFLLSCLISNENNVSSRALGSKYLIDLIKSDLNAFFKMRFDKLEKLTQEEAEYYWNATMKYGDANEILQVSSAYYKNNAFKNIVIASLVDINLDDTKKLMVIESLVFDGYDENTFVLINGRVNKIDFNDFQKYLNQILSKEFTNEIEKKGVDISSSIVRGYSKFIAISIIMDTDVGEGIKNLEKYLTDMASLDGESLNILTAPHNIALCSSIMTNPSTLKNPKVKRYLPLKKTDRELLLELLRKEEVEIK